MLRIPSVDLPAEVAGALAAWQREVDEAGDFAARVRVARQRFEARNRENNPVFREVRRCLTMMCSGARRCMLCEDSAADEVEHFRPKSLYPDRAFAWANLLYACGPCNGPKGNDFRVVLRSGEEIDVARRSGAATEPPPEGDPLLIDPRHEDPLDLLELDLDGTFFFCPRSEPSSPAWRRATYTIDLLGLNQRDYLVWARRGACDAYQALLRRYVEVRDAAPPEGALGRLIASLRTLGHWTVWQEMKRQRPSLFEAAPEALTW